MVKQSETSISDERRRALARLAALQRLKEEMRTNNRTAMLRTIDEMMEAEANALRSVRDRDAEPQV